MFNFRTILRPAFGVGIDLMGQSLRYTRHLIPETRPKSSKAYRRITIKNQGTDRCLRAVSGRGSPVALFSLFYARDTTNRLIVFRQRVEEILD